MNAYLALILLFLIADYLLEFVINWRNLQVLKPTVPGEFQALYDADKYRKAQEYLRVNTRHQLLEQGVSLLALLAFIAVHGFAWLDSEVRLLGWSTIPTGLVYIGVLGILSSLLSLPFSYYHTFVIEQDYGFNRTTRATFFADLLKGLLLTLILGGLVLALVLWFFQSFADRAWLFAWAGLVVIQLLVLFIAPAVIMPLFNKFEPLPDGELKQEIEALSRRLQFQVSGLFTMDGSKRSAKANAYFTGFGRFRRIVLFDTLIQRHTVPELVAILAHEIGHFRLKHIVKSFVLSIVFVGLMLFFLNVLIREPGLFEAFGIEGQPIYASLVFAMLLFTPLGKIISIISRIFSRKHEFEADAFAAQNYGQPETLVEALKKLSVENLANLSPHRWKVFVDYTHPPVLERIRALRGLKGQV